LTLADKKITRKELLKEPDEFLTLSTKIIRHARLNPRMYTTGFAALIVIVLAVLGWFAYSRQQEVRSHELFEQAYASYEQLTNQGAPTSEQLDRVFQEFDRIAKEYGSRIGGEMALLYSGHVLYKKQDYKEALERYNRLQSSNLVQHGLGPLVTYHMAMTRMAMKEYEQALALFDQLSKDTLSPYRREAYSSIAKTYELMGKNKEAVQAYKQYLKMFPEAPDASFVKTRIMELSAKG
jgi:predicted negative regulator of RcsB-dependent stress response